MRWACCIESADLVVRVRTPTWGEVYLPLPPPPGPQTDRLAKTTVFTMVLAESAKTLNSFVGGLLWSKFGCI
jgi:hypothetical protein